MSTFLSFPRLCLALSLSHPLVSPVSCLCLNFLCLSHFSVSCLCLTFLSLSLSHFSVSVSCSVLHCLFSLCHFVSRSPVHFSFFPSSLSSFVPVSSSGVACLLSLSHFSVSVSVSLFCLCLCLTFLSLSHVLSCTVSSHCVLLSQVLLSTFLSFPRLCLALFFSHPLVSPVSCLCLTFLSLSLSHFSVSV